MIFDNTVKLLPPTINIDGNDKVCNFESVEILKVLNLASRALAELKGESKTIPNIDILINTLSLQESKESSEIENIITTQDDLFMSVVTEDIRNTMAKEVRRYKDALLHGFDIVKNKQLLTTNDIIAIQSVLEPNNNGLRKVSGTKLKNNSGDVIYEPLQNYFEVLELMTNLDKYVNIPEFHEVDPLIKMAIIHHQFECIHPFYDGNGRTGRIINILYLVYAGLLDIPVLYLSRYINKNKADYYRLLQETRLNNNYDQWIIWMLQGISETALQTITLIREIKNLIDMTKQKILNKAPSLYSKELLDSLFKHPYTKINFIEHDLNYSRNTASKYLNGLAESGVLEKVKLSTSNFYVNTALFNLLSNCL